MKRNLPLLIILGVLIVAFVVSLLLYKTMKTAPEAANSQKQSQTAAQAVAGAEPPHVRGLDSAPVTLEEYGDFECPPCGGLYPILKNIEKEYGDRLRVVFRQFPLSQIHKHAYDAARAAEAANAQGKFWEMHDMLYEKQQEWTLSPDPRTDFINYARALNLNEDAFMRDMVGEVASTRVMQDMRRGKSRGVVGTPTLFVADRQLKPEEMTVDGLHKAIEDALIAKGK
ncbi:MAG: thioredoxin domain-containing protein [Acidobacteria bacterium]|nr:thioredoxin domain-containing protein [Acidobacteriota bacterium]